MNWITRPHCYINLSKADSVVHKSSISGRNFMDQMRAARKTLFWIQLTNGNTTESLVFLKDLIIAI